mgnify:FL=1
MFEDEVVNAVNGSFASSGDVVRLFLEKKVPLEVQQVARIIAAYIYLGEEELMLKYKLIPLKSKFNQLMGDNYHHAQALFKEYNFQVRMIPIELSRQ